MKKLLFFSTLSALALTGCEEWLNPNFEWSCKKEMKSFSAASCSAFDSGSYHSRTCHAWGGGKSYTYTWDDDDKLPGSNSNGCLVSSIPTRHCGISLFTTSTNPLLWLIVYELKKTGTTFSHIWIIFELFTHRPIKLKPLHSFLASRNPPKLDQNLLRFWDKFSL